MHPLRIAYRDYISEHYGARSVGSAKGIEEKAQAIHSTGLTYEQYVEFACSILHNTAEYYGWPYPYWNAVVSNATIEKVKCTKELVSDSLIADEDYATLFNAYLSYGMHYLKWWQGLSGVKPVRVDVSVSIRVDVAEYMCAMYGVPFESSNLNIIAGSIERKLNGKHF